MVHFDYNFNRFLFLIKFLANYAKDLLFFLTEGKTNFMCKKLFTISHIPKTFYSILNWVNTIVDK